MNNMNTPISNITIRSPKAPFKRSFKKDQKDTYLWDRFCDDESYENEDETAKLAEFKQKLDDRNNIISFLKNNGFEYHGSMYFKITNIFCTYADANFNALYNAYLVSDPDTAESIDRYYLRFYEQLLKEADPYNRDW